MDASPSTSASVDRVQAMAEAHAREDEALLKSMRAADNPVDTRAHDNSTADAEIGAWVAEEERLEEERRQESEAAKAGRATVAPKRWNDKAFAERKRKVKTSKASKRRNRR